MRVYLKEGKKQSRDKSRSFVSKANSRPAAGRLGKAAALLHRPISGPNRRRNSSRSWGPAGRAAIGGQGWGWFGDRGSPCCPLGTSVTSQRAQGTAPDPPRPSPSVTKSARAGSPLQMQPVITGSGATVGRAQVAALLELHRSGAVAVPWPCPLPPSPFHRQPSSSEVWRCRSSSAVTVLGADGSCLSNHLWLLDLVQLPRAGLGCRAPPGPPPWQGWLAEPPSPGWTDGRRCGTSHFRNSFAISQIPGWAVEAPVTHLLGLTAIPFLRRSFTYGGI